MKCHDEFLCREPPDPQPQAGPHIGNATRSPSHFLLQVPLRYTYSPRPASGWPKQAFFALPQGPEAEDPGCEPQIPPPTPSTQATALTHPHWRVPAARGPPGCRQVPRNPRHSLCPQSHSPAGPRRQPPGPPRPLRGPRSQTTRRSQSHQPFSPRLCRSVRLVLGSARRVPRAAPGGRGTVTRAPRGEPLGLGGDGLSAAAPHFLSATGPGSPVTAAAGGRSRDGNAVMSPAEGGGPQDGRRSPLSGHRRAAAGRRRSPRGPGPRYPLAATSGASPGHRTGAAPAGSGGEADGTKGPSRVQGHRRLAARISGAPSGWSQRNLAPPDSFCTSFFSKARRVL